MANFTCYEIPEPDFDAGFTDDLVVAYLEDEPMQASFPDHYPNQRVDDLEQDLTDHTEDTDNPHQTTAEQVGADPSGAAASAIQSHESHNNHPTQSVNASDSPEFSEVIIPSLQDATSGGSIADYDWNWLGVTVANKKKTSKVIEAMLGKVKNLSLMAPTNLTISILGGDVTLAWTKASLIIEAYKVERSTDNVNFIVIATTTADAISYTDSTVLEYTQYYYRVRAFSGLLYSAYSNVVNGLTEAFAWYGVEINEANSSPDVTRIGSSMSLHASLPVHALLKGCILSDAGIVSYYLKADDWTKKADGSASNMDGTDGQVMIEWPDFYYSCSSPSSGKWQIKISTSPITGFTKVPKHYISAYQSALNRTTSKMASVKNLTTTYRGGDNLSTVDAAYNSRLGTPVTNFTRTNGRIYARNRGTGWNLYGYEDHKWLLWFFVIEYATLNSQKAVNATLTAEGYRQGGLGNGVTTVDGTQWNNNFAYCPFVPCGKSDALANGSGEVSFTIANWLPSALTVYVPRYRGHEHPFGHIFEILDGVNIEAQAVASGNEHKLWVAANPADWNDVNYTNYTLKASLPRTDGYQSKAIMGATADFMPSAVAGASNTYYCDYAYQSIPASGIVLRMLLFGGHALYGAGAGLAFSYSSAAPSNASANIGSRLRFLAV